MVTKSERVYNAASKSSYHANTLGVWLKEIRDIDKYVFDKYDLKSSDISNLNRIQKNLLKLHDDLSSGKLVVK